ncbi:hypothetical protein TNIN_410251 [Trichonephila inaurata madagascariensis]|uniref:Uncharacterized protein n=1 Tax=Trichonephila inaurata madagascariensis TaxID=2747483 RepID=A0A8X6IRE4_9ARAC|nr:hypothetical protein TNIN_410251 [Trichonephila inaurata madagascariensis]
MESPDITKKGASVLPGLDILKPLLDPGVSSSLAHWWGKCPAPLRHSSHRNSFPTQLRPELARIPFLRVGSIPEELSRTPSWTPHSGKEPGG